MFLSGGGKYGRYCTEQSSVSAVGEGYEGIRRRFFWGWWAYGLMDPAALLHVLQTPSTSLGKIEVCVKVVS